MTTQEQRKINPDVIHGPGPVLGAPLWPTEHDPRDILSPPRLLREPRFNDGDLLHGDGP